MDALFVFVQSLLHCLVFISKGVDRGFNVGILLHILLFFWKREDKDITELGGYVTCVNVEVSGVDNFIAWFHAVKSINY